MAPFLLRRRSRTVAYPATARTAQGPVCPAVQPQATLSALRLLVAVVVYLVLVMVKVVILTSIAVTATTAAENPMVSRVTVPWLRPMRSRRWRRAAPSAQHVVVVGSREAEEAFGVVGGGGPAPGQRMRHHLVLVAMRDEAETWTPPTRRSRSDPLPASSGQTVVDARDVAHGGEGRRHDDGGAGSHRGQGGSRPRRQRLASATMRAPGSAALSYAASTSR